MDSRTDAHGNPLSAGGTGHAARRRRRGHQHRHDHPGAHPQQREVGDRDLDPPRLLRRGARRGQDEDQRRLRLGAPGEAEANWSSNRASTRRRPSREATEAGREALIKTVANLTGVTVDHYAEIGLLGFALITDALGGVNVCLKDAVYEPLSGADFPAGWQKLDGPQALSFVRQRHDLPRGDLDRVVRQQAVMASLAHQVISGQDAVQPGHAEPAAGRRPAFGGAVRRLGHHGFRRAAAEAGRRATSRSPPSRCSRRTAGATTACRAWCGWTRARCKEWVDGLLHDQDEGKTEELAYTPDKTTADVVNDTDINGLAAAVSQVLTSQGIRRRQRRQQRGRPRHGQPGAGRQGR